MSGCDKRLSVTPGDWAAIRCQKRFHRKPEQRLTTHSATLTLWDGFEPVTATIVWTTERKT